MAVVTAFRSSDIGRRHFELGMSTIPIARWKSGITFSTEGTLCKSEVRDMTASQSCYQEEADKLGITGAERVRSTLCTAFSSYIRDLAVEQTPSEGKAILR